MLLGLRHEGGVHRGGHSGVRALLLLLLLLLIEGAGLPRIEAHLRLLRRSGLLSLLLSLLLLLRSRLLLLLLLLLCGCGSGSVLLLRRHPVRSVLRIQLLRLLRLPEHVEGLEHLPMLSSTGSHHERNPLPLRVYITSASYDARAGWLDQAADKAPEMTPLTRRATQRRTGTQRRLRRATMRLTASRIPSAGTVTAAAVAAEAAPAVVAAGAGEAAG